MFYLFFCQNVNFFLLTLDSSDPMIIKNLAYVCAAAGENEQAMEFVSKLPMVDFGILKTIK